MNHLETLEIILQRVARDPHVDRRETLSAVFEEFRSREAERPAEEGPAASDARRRALLGFFQLGATSAMEALLATGEEGEIDFFREGFGRRFDLPAFTAALSRLAEERPREATIFQLCFFAGLTRLQVGELLDDSAEAIEAGYTRAKSRITQWIDSASES